MADVLLTYYIGLTDEAVVKEQQEKRHPRYDGKIHSTPGLLFFAPPGDHVGMTYASGPIKGWAEPTGPGPYTWSPFFDPAAGGHDGAFPTNVATFTRKAGGFWGWLGFGATRFYWVGKFVLAPATDELPVGPEDPGEVPPAKLPIQQRRWLDGFEAPDLGGGGSGNLVNTYVSVDASRHLGGYGLGMRSVTNSTFIKPATVLGLAATASDWERIYVRVRRRPSGGGGRFIYVEFSGGSGGAGISLEIMPTGAIAIYQHVSIGTFTLIGTTATPLTINQWYRLDFYYTAPPVGGTGPTATDGSFNLYIGGRLAFSGPISASLIGNLTTTATHSSTTLGSAVSTNNMELDLDDWVCVSGVPTKATLDWRNGSAVIPARGTGYGSGHDAVGWPGDFRVLLQRPLIVSGPDQWLTSNTALARLELDTDADTSIDAMPGSVGYASMVVSRFGTRGSTSGTLGYKIGAAAEVLAAVTESVIAGWTSVLHTISGVLEPVETIAPLKLIHVKGNDTSNATTYGLMAQVECIGQFGPEDALEGITGAEPVNVHNWPYPRSPWGINAANAPLAPVAIYYGTYVGNGTAQGVGAQDINFPTPVHWIWIRPVAASHVGTHWWSTMLAAHSGVSQGVKPTSLAMAFLDPDFAPGTVEDSQQQQATLRIGGNNPQVNQNGITYQYVAFGDPGMRFLHNLVISHRQATTIATALVNDNFHALAAWFFQETFGSASSSAHFFKGPNNTAAGYNLRDGAETADAVTMALGSLSTQTAFHAAVNQVAVSLWRRHDNSEDPNVADVVAIGSYVGDGSASRTIGVSPASTKSPLFCWVQSRTAPTGGFWRDPSHTGTTSSTASGSTNLSTGITGGDISSFTVGSSLNASGQLYSYFIIWGTATPGGWTPAPAPGPPVVITPVEPIVPPDSGPWPTNLSPDEDPGTDPDEGEPEPFVPGPGLAEDLAVGLCADTTHAIMNLALSRVGNSQHIDAVLTDETLEAHLAGEHWDEAVLQTLRDFPWPFATKYATLALVGGTSGAAVNGDWQYSYRRPGDCVFERRIVVPRAGAVDPEPPQFGLGFDTTGGLIFTNEVAPKLEYTARPACVAFQGDPLFRDALAWKLASILGPPLSRMPEVSANAATMYVQAIANAERVLKPGNPGARPAAPTVDVADACQAANVLVANLALVRIGAQSIMDLTTDQSREANLVRLVFENELRATLREFPWPFATVYDNALAVVDGSDTDPVNADWTYSYRLPADYITARRLVTPNGRRFEPSPYPFKVARDTTGDLLFTDQADPILEYTARIECAVEHADALFRDAFAWRLAATLGPSLAAIDPETPEQQGRGPEPISKDKPPSTARASLRERMTRYAWTQYYNVIVKAQVSALNEGQRETEQGDAPWHRARGGGGTSWQRDDWED